MSELLKRKDCDIMIDNEIVEKMVEIQQGNLKLVK